MSDRGTRSFLTQLDGVIAERDAALLEAGITDPLGPAASGSWQSSATR